jgi:hypothetical protein
LPLIEEFFYHDGFIILIKNKYAFFNIKNFLRFLKNEEKEKIKEHLKSNLLNMNKKDTEKFTNFLNSIYSN